MGDHAPAQLVAYGVAALLLVVVGVRYLEGRGSEPTSTAPPVTLDGPGGESSADPGDPGDGDGLYVHVAGAVRKEGLLRLPEGARVGAAVDRAGGPLARADLSGVNLAAQVQDGQQIVVPKRGAVPAPAASAPAAGAAPSSAATGGAPAGPPISLATATVEQLDAGVEGIGPTLAQRIVEYRDQNGGFKSIDELREVSGIGEARFTALSEAVSP